MRTKSMGTRDNDRARAVVKRLVTARFESISAAAEAMGVSQPTLSDFLNGKTGVGPAIIAGVQRVDKRALIEIFNLEPALGAAAPTPPRIVVSRLVSAGYSGDQAERAAQAAVLLLGESADPEALTDAADFLAKFVRVLAAR